MLVLLIGRQNIPYKYLLQDVSCCAVLCSVVVWSLVDSCAILVEQTESSAVGFIPEIGNRI